MKNRMRLAAAALALSMAGFGLTGCSGQAKETEAKTEAADKQAGSAQTGDTQEKGDQADDGQAKEGQTADGKTYKVALCLSGAANDMGWCQSAYDGLKLLEADYGCEVTYTENLTPDDIEAAFADYAASGYDVVIGHGYEFGDPAVDVAEQYPDTKFIVTEGEVSADNVASYVSKCEEGGYIMGMLAAGMSESGKVGFIGPIQGASLVKIMNGFEDGAKEAKVYATGDSYDQNDLAPDTILSSSVYHIPHVIEVAFKTVADGTFEGGIYQLGMADGAVSVAPYHNLDSAVPDELKQKISDKIAAIESGEFEVPCDTKPRA